MSNASDSIKEKYGNKLRIRICGILIYNNRILLVKHRGIGPNNIYHIPPGGGMETGESAHQTLQREFKEETGLNILPDKLLIVNEFLNPPLHAIELFFNVHFEKGNLIKGYDSEMFDHEQIIENVGFYTFKKILNEDKDNYHPIVWQIAKDKGVDNLSGYKYSGI